MLTLKVITTNINGDKDTRLFSADSISHREYFSDDHCIYDKVQENSPEIICLGHITQTSSNQKFTVSDIALHDGHSFREIFVLPKTECFIMCDGKTVDRFVCEFEGGEEEILHPSTKKEN